MIRINGEEWRVLLVSPSHPCLLRSDGVATLGCCDDLDKTIYIDETVNDFCLKKVLCHELTHASMFSYDVELSYEQDEIVADLFATYGRESLQIVDKVLQYY